MSRSTYKRILYSLVLAALLLSAVAPASVVPAATLGPDQAPAPSQAPPPPGGAFRLAPPADPPAAAPAAQAPALQASAPPVAVPPAAEVEEASDASADAPDSPQACTAPAKVPFGKDVELMMGPYNTSASYNVTQAASWGGAAIVSVMGTLTNSVTGCTSSGPRPEEVYFYENDNYGGSCYILGPGSFANGGAMGVHDDHLTSIKVGANVEVTIYEDSDYGGGNATFTSNIWHMKDTAIHNDHASSAKVYLRPHAYGTVAAIPVGTDAVQMVMKTDSDSGELAAQTWVDGTGWGALTRLGLSTAGNPILVSRTPMDYDILARSGAQIKRMKVTNRTQAGAWETLPNAANPIADAASDPAAVALSPYHVLVFYRTDTGYVKFTEWRSGYGWRAATSLGKPVNNTISIASELTAIARDENHVAVFGVGTDSKLYVKEWSAKDNALNWSDTTWTMVMDSVKQASKPAVASVHTRHLAVLAVNSSSNGLRYRDWTESAGWSTATTFGGYVEPVNLTATSTGEMYATGVNASGFSYARRWTTAGWEGSWSAALATTFRASSPTVAAATRPSNLMVIGRDGSDRVHVQQLNNTGRTVTATQNTNPGYGEPRAQAIATISANTVWVSAYESNAAWYITARDTSTWAGKYWSVSGGVGQGTANTASSKAALTVADVDWDGNDEVILATIDSTGTTVTLGVYDITHDGTAVAGLYYPAIKTISFGTQQVDDVQVAVGDLGDMDDDPAVDARPYEIVVAARKVGFDTENITVFGYAGATLTQLYSVDKNVGYHVKDIEMAIGQFDGLAGEQIALGAAGLVMNLAGTWQLSKFRFVRTPANPDTNEPVSYRLDEATVKTGSLTMYELVTGAYGSALAAGDVNSDGLDEMIYAVGWNVFVLKPSSALARYTEMNVSSNNSNRSVAVGDVDGDGRAEIVSSSSLGTYILKIPDPFSPSLIKVGSTTSMIGVPLLADLDGDSTIATYVTCNTFRDVQVIAAVNASPMWFVNGTSRPPGKSDFGMSYSREDETESLDGWEANWGASVSVGVEVEILCLFTKLGEVRSSVTQEFMGSVSRSHSRTSGVATTTGYELGEGNSFVTGGVLYADKWYTCYKYMLSKPGSSITTPAMTCVVDPANSNARAWSSFTTWYGSIRSEADDSWVPVGHGGTKTTNPSVSLANYTEEANCSTGKDPMQIWWQGSCANPFTVIHDDDGALQLWSVEQTTGGTDTEGGSFGTNTTVSAGATAMGVTVDASVSAGYGKEWSTSVGWEEGLQFFGKFYDFDNDGSDANCPGCTTYKVVPYVYRRMATTDAGVSYPFLELDYVVQDILNAGQGGALPKVQTVAGPPPQAPVISSATHPNPGAWYSANTIELSWAQPAGDPAAVLGYKWTLDHTPVITPAAPTIMTTTQTFSNMSDGLYYLHLQAISSSGDSPVVHRAVRVDAGAPKVEFVAKPFMPDGWNGWYNTPVTVSVTATDTTGSGVAAVQTSANGTTWATYSAPIPITANTPGYTLWARATDNAGHTSDSISTTIKLDQTPPSVRDSDRYGLSYARLITDEVGNMQLVLGGALSDTLSGRLQVEVKAGDTGQWNAVSGVGDLPMPPGNWFTTTMTSLQWMYTPTFEIRGAYPLYVRGVDVAGNYGHYYSNTLIMPGGCVWWDPIAAPALDESRVSAWPHVVKPGHDVAFTVAARNSGYQEAQYLITDTVPVGLTVLPGSISDNGQYNASTREITWLLHGLWPGQTRYLSFQATADSAATTTALENKLDLMAYWPWDRSCDPRVPPEPARHYYSTSTTLTVLQGVSLGASATAATSDLGRPHILDAAVVEGDIVGDPQVTLLVNASPEARSLYVKEWVWNSTSNVWSLAQESGWVPFQAAAGLTMWQDAGGKYGRYQWTLSQGDGVKYLGIWVADEDGQISNLSEGNLIYTNLVSAGGRQLAAGQRVQYRVNMRADQLAILTLVSLSGDADLYAWKPRAGLKPHYYSNAVPTGGLSLDSVGFYAGEEGMYVIEVQAVTDAYYRLVTAGDISGAGLPAETQGEDLPASTHLALAEKARPAHPVTLTTPFSLLGAEQLPEAARTYKNYFPLIFHQ